MTSTSMRSGKRWLGLPLNEVVLVIVVAVCICIGIGVFAIKAPQGADLSSMQSGSEAAGDSRELRASGPINEQHK